MANKTPRRDGDASRIIPRLRVDLEYIPVKYQGRKGVVIKDPLGLIREPILLADDGLLVLGLLDRPRPLQDIQVDLVRVKGGALVTLAQVKALADELESALILESESYQREKIRLEKEYAGLRTRPASHAGQAYPSNVAELTGLLDLILAEGEAGGVEAAAQDISAVVAPHIDLEVGRKVYGRTYAALRGLKPETVLLLGTGHHLTDSALALSEKDFETPLGLVRSDRALIKKLRAAAGRAAAPTDFSHRQEHSLEFQLLFLQRLFGSGFRLIPILFGSFSAELPRAHRAREIPDLLPFLHSLAEWLAREGSRALVVAGVDFSHIGPKFGHKSRASALKAEAERHDRRLIEAVCGRDARSFWDEVRGVEDRFNVCGFPALACLLEILPPGPGRLLAYDFWMEEPTQSAVSFAGLAFSRA